MTDKDVVDEDPFAGDQDPFARIDTTVPHSARIWNHWLGGKDNYEVDRVAGDEYRKVFPGIVDMARASRLFIARTVRYLAGDVGIRQFLDIGTGLPTVDNTHEVAQRVARETRIVYVDNDPLVLAHARALLTSTPEGATHYLDANLHEPEGILQDAGKILDFSRPIVLMLMGILGHVTDYGEARSIVERLLAALPPGSCLALYDGTDQEAALQEAQQGYDDTGAIPYVLRSAEQVAGYFEGLDLVEPGVVSCPLWRPEASPFGQPEEAQVYGGIGFKR